MPTKAVLYGLDVRFRAVEKKMDDEKSINESYYKIFILGRKNAFKTQNKKIMNEESGAK